MRVGQGFSHCFFGVDAASDEFPSAVGADMVEADCAGCALGAFVVADVGFVLIVERLVAFLAVVSVIHISGMVDRASVFALVAISGWERGESGKSYLRILLCMRRITISVTEQVGREVEEISNRTGMKVSQIFRMALEEHMRLHYVKDEEIQIRPTVIWKTKGRNYARGPSPTLRQGQVGEYRIVSLDEISL